MSVFYINGVSSIGGNYTYGHFYDNTIPNSFLGFLAQKKKSNNRYIYSSTIESSEKSNLTNEIIIKNPTINLDLSHDITKAIIWKNFNN